MAIHVGKVEEFDGAVDDWPSYMERLEHFFDANKIGAEQKKSGVSSVYWQENVRPSTSSNCSR